MQGRRGAPQGCRPGAATGHARAMWPVLAAFALAVMGDPVSSVAYAIEAVLRALGGDLRPLAVAMGLVLGAVALVDLSYHHLLGRFPRGGGSAAAAAAAFGEGWAFVPLGALTVDYALTAALGASAAAAAAIAYDPGLAPWRVPLALALLGAVAALTVFGHGGRAVFAATTAAFAAVAAAVLVRGFAAPAGPAGHAALASGPPPGPLAVVLAATVGMAFATGTEAPASAVAQLGGLDDRARVVAGRVTLWLTLVTVGSLTLALALLAQRAGAGLPPPRHTLVAELAAYAVGPGRLFAAFQGTSALLLLAAANSAFNAGPGLLRALADRRGPAILPAWLGRTNRHHTPLGGLAVFLGAAAVLVLAAGARDQLLVRFYAVAVFVAFLFGLAAAAAFAWREGRPWALAAAVAGALVVAVALAADVWRLYPLAPLAASAAMAAFLHARWVGAGRPSGVAGVEAAAVRGPAAAAGRAVEPAAMPRGAPAGGGTADGA